MLFAGSYILKVLFWNYYMINTAQTKVITEKKEDIVFQGVSFLHSTHYQTNHQFLNYLVQKKLGNDCFLKSYYQDEIDQLTEAEMMEIATCYSTVFRESWNEPWTPETALKEIKRQLNRKNNENIYMNVLYKGETVIGFAWAEILDTINLTIENSTPREVCKREKELGYNHLKYWLKNITKKNKIVFGREIGILKEFRRTLYPILMIDLFKKSYDVGCSVIIGWAAYHTNAFKWNLGVRMTPIYFSLDYDRILMAGPVEQAILALSKTFDPNLLSQKDRYKAVYDNINYYLCK